MMLRVSRFALWMVETTRESLEIADSHVLVMKMAIVKMLVSVMVSYFAMWIAELTMESRTIAGSNKPVIEMTFVKMLVLILPPFR